MGLRTTQSKNGLSAETAPLLGPPDANPASSNKVASHSTFTASSSDAPTSTSNTENGLLQVEATTNGASGDSPKPTVKMAVLLPALSIGVSPPRSSTYIVITRWWPTNLERRYSS